MWQTFTIDIIKKEAVGYSPNGINRNHDSSEAKIFLRATQGEVGVKFVAILLCSGEPYYVSDGAEFSVWYEGMSGAGNYTEINGRSPVVLEENALQIELIPQMIAVSGGGTLGVMLHEANGDIRKLFHLTYIVDEFPGYGSAAAEEYFTAFSKAVSDMKNTVTKAEEISATFETDMTLSVVGKAADAAITGAALTSKVPTNRMINGKKLTEDVILRAEDIGAATMELAAPHNYLDNSDFRNPVNQRGQTNYASAAYCIDRWTFSTAPAACTVAKGSGVTISAGSVDVYFNQRFAPHEGMAALAGKFVTLAVLSNKGLLLKSSVFPTIQGELSRTSVGSGVSMTIGYSASGQSYWVDIVVSAGTSLTLYWAALYEGEYTAETLPEYKPKGYAAELAECLRYYQKDVRLNAMHTADSYFAVSYMHRMRIAPTVTPQRFDFYGAGAVETFDESEFGADSNQLQFAYLPTVTSSSHWQNGSRGALTVDLNADL